MCASVQGGDCAIEGKDDREDFRRLLNAMDILCFTPDELNGVYRLLSSVLHLGNVFFQPHQVGPSIACARAGTLAIKMQFVSCLADNDNVDRGREIMNAFENVCLLVGVGMAGPLQAEGQEVASVVSAHEIRVAAELLQVSPEGLQKSVTFKMTVGLHCDAHAHANAHTHVQLIR